MNSVHIWREKNTPQLTVCELHPSHERDVDAVPRCHRHEGDQPPNQRRQSFHLVADSNHYTTHDAISAKNRMRMPENCRMCEWMGHRCIETECCDQSSSSGCNIGGAQRRDGNFNITRPEGEYFKMGISASPNLKKNIYVPFYSSGVEGTKVIFMTCLCN